MNPEISPLGPISREPQAVQSQKQERVSLGGANIEQVEESTEDVLESGGVRSAAIRGSFQKLEELSKKKSEAKSSENAEEELIEQAAKAEETATRFQGDNKELDKKALLLLRASLANTDSPEEILKKVLAFYPDYSLADEAFDFLLETSQGELATKILLAKELLNTTYKREVLAGKNIRAVVQDYSKQGLETPTNLRDLYRNVTAVSKNPLLLFDELSRKFTYTKMNTVVQFFLHSLGADLNAKGPSIPPPQLLLYLEDIRTLQAILGVYAFFKSRLRLIYSQFKRKKIPLNKSIQFETLAKQFVKILQERYLSKEKILSMSSTFGISEDIAAQIILFSQMRDGIRQVSPRLFKSDLHRQEILLALIEALEKLEEEEEEEEEKPEKGEPTP